MKPKKAFQRLKAWRAGRDKRLPGHWWKIACQRGWVDAGDCFKRTGQEAAHFFGVDEGYFPRG